MNEAADVCMVLKKVRGEAGGSGLGCGEVACLAGGYCKECYVVGVGYCHSIIDPSLCHPLVA